MENNTHGNNLQHHGVIGMKWGVRRYQNKDGTLTKAGKRRYAKELAKLTEEERALKNKAKTKAMIDKLEKKRQQVEEMKNPAKQKAKPAESKTKSINEMSDDELNRLVNRLNNEKRYSELRPQEVSKGKKFVEGLWSKGIEPAIQETVKSVLKNAMTNMVSDAMNKKKK